MAKATYPELELGTRSMRGLVGAYRMLHRVWQL